MAGIVFSKISGHNNDVYGKSEYPIKMIIESKAEAYEKQSVLPLIYNMEKSRNFGEKLAYMTAMDDFTPVPEGGAFTLSDFQEGYSKTFEHVTWKNQFEVTREMLDDNKTIDLKNGAGKFIGSYGRTRERFGVRLLGAATALTATKATLTFGNMEFDANSADGVAQFCTAHPSKVSKKLVQSNIFAGAGSGDPFTSEYLSEAETVMQNFRDDNGNILGVAPDTIVIQNNAEMKRLVFGVIGADKRPETNHNALNYTFGRWNVIIAPEWKTTSGTEWILMSAEYNKDNMGAVWYDRMPLSISPHVNESNWNMVWSGMARFTAGFNDWRFAAMFNVSGATSLVS